MGSEMCIRDSTSVANISQTGRATLGVKVMKLDADAKIVTFALVETEDEEVVLADNQEVVSGEATVSNSEEIENG